MKRLVWTALLTAASAFGAAAAARLMDRLWRSVAHEPPPERPGWARWLLGKPLHGQITRRVYEPIL